MLRWYSVLLVAALALLLRFYADNFIEPTTYAGAFTSARQLATPITYNQTCSESYDPHIYGCHPMPPQGCSRKIIDDFISSDDVEVIKGMAGMFHPCFACTPRLIVVDLYRRVPSFGPIQKSIMFL